MSRFTLGVLLLVGGVLIPADRAAGQQDADAARQVLESQGVTETEILRRLQSSGLSRAEIKRRLVQAGYDASLVDVYMDRLDRQRTSPLAAPDELLYALDEIGVTYEGIPVDEDTVGTSIDDVPPRPISRERDTARVGGQPIFGRGIFLGRTTEFNPATSGPVPSDYRLGPGDQLVLIVTGAAETAYTMNVMRDGAVVVPDVGPIPVNGLTLEQTEALLMERLGRVYSGLGRGEGATNRLSLSVSRIRTNQVVVAGDVEAPGSYTISSLGTVFTALYAAGGPNPIGSFRRVEVRRGGRLAGSVDLYDYLIHGGGRDVRLEQGDFVFVPVAGPRVAIEGAVRRPAAYELAPGEGLADLLRFAGGLQADAVVRRIQIDRILPPYERRPGVDRVFVDVDLEAVAGRGAEVPLEDGDVVRIFSVSEARRNHVTITGEVNREGTYQWHPDMTLDRLIERAEGLSERALLSRAHVFRLNRETGQRELLPVSLGSAGAGAGPMVPLADRDSVVVLSQRALAMTGEVHIDGFVKAPGSYELRAGMTVEDLILLADGYETGADVTEAEVARMPPSTARSDTVARVIRVRLSHGPPGGAAAGTGRPTGAGAWAPTAEDVVLRDGDRVFIRKAPGYEPLRTVTVTGEVVTPSEFVLESRTSRITDVLARAGGLTREASVEGGQLIRDDRIVAVDLSRAQARPGSRHDFVLEAGDSLHVPKFDPTVLVIGNGVAFASRVPYQPGAGLSYYIAQSGGYTEYADRERVSITYQNGERAISQPVLLFRRHPQPRPGSTVMVPEVPAAERLGLNVGAMTSTALGVLTSAATLLLLLNELR